MAVFLGRAGHRVQLVERRPDPRRGPAAGGRSINLAISTRGLDALDRVGLASRLLEAAVPMRGRLIHGRHGDLAFQPYGTAPDHVIHSVSRSGLNRILLEAAESLAGVRVIFGKRCVAADLDRPSVRLLDAETGETEEFESDALVAADGAFSEVRTALQRTDRFEFAQSFLSHGYRELTIRPGHDGRHAMDPRALHIWPRGGFMTIALPNADGSFTATCFWPFHGENGLLTPRTPQQVRDYFESVFPDAVPLMPDLVAEFLANPVGSLVTVRCFPWHWKDKVVLLGDAAHAIVPFYGQGANAAFEDCVVLDERLRAHPADWETAFREYADLRKPHTDALADLAIGNFVEMRDKTASSLFRARKKLEKVLHRILPGWFVPLYTMVTFSRTPYAEAVRRARRQWSAVAWAGVALAVALLAAAALGIVAWTS